MFDPPHENQASFKSRSENLERSHYDENAKILTQSEANLNQDDLSQINDLSSIDSLLAAMPMSKKKINNESYFSKLKNNFLFYLKIELLVIDNVIYYYLLFFFLKRKKLIIIKRFEKASN